MSKEIEAFVSEQSAKRAKRAKRRLKISLLIAGITGIAIGGSYAFNAFYSVESKTHASSNMNTLAETLRACSFSFTTLPSDMTVVAAGAYSGRVLNYQIDQSGHQATQFDVDVHSKKPIALILGAYEPAVWNLRWTADTSIKAVYVTGYHRQVVAGIPPSVPLLNTSFENKSSCGYNYISSDEKSLSWLNPKSIDLFGSKVQRVYPAKQGSIVIDEPGEAPSENANYSYVTYDQNNPQAYFDKNAPLAGKAGIEDAVAKGLIRPLTAEDLKLVRAHYEKIAKRSSDYNSLPPIAGKTNTETVATNVPNIFNGYAVLKPFNIPAGLYGANSASFVVMPGVEYPKGNPGHGIIIDLNNDKVACSGVLCDH